MEDDLQIFARYYLSFPLIQAAAFYARRAQEIEDAFTGPPTLDPEHRAHVMSAVLMAWAFLEAYINELCADASEDGFNERSGLTAAANSTIAQLWDNGLEATKTLDKYQFILATLGHGPFDKGALPYQDASLLKNLRNRLVHASPETTEIAPNRPVASLERQLGNKFPVNKLMAKNINPFFPDKCLGAGCARWAHDSANRFVKTFNERLGIEDKV